MATTSTTASRAPAKASANALLQAIKAKCMDCCCHVRDEIYNCSITTCPLYSFKPVKGDKPVTRQRRKEKEALSC